MDPETKLEIKEISAISIYRDIPYLGSFIRNDDRLNKIWQRAETMKKQVTI